ncbi:MAG: hypothetical protein Q8R00_03305 [Candidatus Nanoarchaeia archaeon]|nr:hypothetical protein [Candidatus Nanoarchaeia archaeon]
MSEGIITYDALYELLRKEKYNQELQKIEKGFYESVITYLKDKQSLLDSQRSKSTIFTVEVEKAQIQLNNVRKILKDLYEKREGKIIQLALFTSRLQEKQDLSLMLPEEQSLYKYLVETFNACRTGILYRLMAGALPEVVFDKPKGIKTEKKSSEETRLVRFVHAVPQFLGDDMNKYGPFEEEDVARLPQKVAQLLVGKSRAEEIKV